MSLNASGSDWSTSSLVALDRLPKPDEFDLGGYTQVAGHHFNEKFPNIDKALNISVAKKGIIEKWVKSTGMGKSIKE